MENKSYLSLKSGSDIRGVAVEAEGHPVTLTEEVVTDVVHAFLKWLSKKTGKQTLNIAVGYDVRISSENIQGVVEKVIMETGGDAINCGLCSTPSMFVYLREHADYCDASIMITASHLPYYMNGLKMFTLEGGLSGNDIEEILAMAAKKVKLPYRLGNNETISFMNDYCKILLNVVRRGTGKSSPLFGKKIIVDAGNGAGGFFVKKVLQQLGATTDGSINLKPDGMFPAHAPNPEDPDAIAALRKAVLNSHADLGVIFDTDVDRAALVDGNGKPINRDTLIALVAATVLQERPATIVTDSVTSEGLAEFITSHGGKHIRYKRGYKNVIDEARRRNARGEYCPVAIETSGHAAFKENYFLDDGAYLVCKLLVTFANQTAKNASLYDLISDLQVPVEEKELRIGFNENSKNFKVEGARVIDELSYFAKVAPNAKLATDNYEGIRISYPAGYGDGWSMARMSVHDPVIVINFASRVLGGNRLMAKKLFYMLDKYPFLDTDSLTDFIIEEY